MLRSGTLLSCVLASSGFAQAFNIDAGGNFAEPPASGYGAAAQQLGYWNGITTFGPVRDLFGSLTSVLFGTAEDGVFLTNIAGASADDQRLMGSMVGVQPADPAAVFINLEPGLYNVYVYCWAGNLLGPKDVTIRAFTDAGQVVGGVSYGDAWPGGHVLGETYDLLRVEVVPGGNQYLSIFIQAPGDFNVINGIQLVLVPAPGWAMITPLAALVVHRRRR